MNFNEYDLYDAKIKGILNVEVYEKLLEFLKNKNSNNTIKEKAVSQPQKKYTLENFLYYLGAFIIILAMGWYLGSVWASSSFFGLFALCIAYFILFVGIGNKFWNKGQKTPGGLLYTCALSVVPLTIWAFEKSFGFAPDDIAKYSNFHIFVRGGWIFMELATVIVGAIFLKYRKFPLLTLPICYALWFLSMDLLPFLVGNIQDPTWGQRNIATLLFSFLMLGIALKYDKKTDEDFSRWFYIYGALMLDGVIISIFAQFDLFKNEIWLFMRALFNILYMILSILTGRKIFMVLGSIGFVGYLSHLAYKVFADSIFFPFVLVILGLGIIFGGIYYAKNCDKIEKMLRKILIPEK